MRPDRPRCADCVQPGKQPCHADYCAMRRPEPVSREQLAEQLDREGIAHNLPRSQ